MHLTYLTLFACMSYIAMGSVHDGILLSGGTCQMNHKYKPWYGDITIHHADLSTYNAAAIALYQGRIFVTGGSSWRGLHFPTNYNQILDTFTGDVIEGAPLRYRRAAHSMVVFKNTLVACGGSGSEGFLLNNCEAYSPFEDVWVEEDFVLPHHLKGHSSIVINGRMLLMGGEGYHGASGATYYRDQYDYRWREASPMNFARTNFAVAEYNNRVVACGGIVDGETVRTCEVFNPDSVGWAVYTPLLGPRSHHVAAVYQNTLYFMGGFDHNATELNTVEYYMDYSNSSFIMYNNLTMPCADMVGISLEF